MRILTRFVLVTALLLSAPRFSIAAPDEPLADSFAAYFDRHAAQLGLDPDTLTRIHAIAEQARLTGDQLREEIHAARKRFGELLSELRPDEKAVMEQAERVGELEKQLLKHRLRALIGIRPLLTDEQLEKLGQLRGQHFEQLGKACWTDIAARCPDAQPGFETARCLNGHAKDVSEGCRAALRSGISGK